MEEREAEERDNSVRSLGFSRPRPATGPLPGSGLLLSEKFWNTSSRLSCSCWQRWLNLLMDYQGSVVQAVLRNGPLNCSESTECRVPLCAFPRELVVALPWILAVDCLVDGTHVAEASWHECCGSDPRGGETSELASAQSTLAFASDNTMHDSLATGLGSVAAPLGTGGGGGRKDVLVVSMDCLNVYHGAKKTNLRLPRDFQNCEETCSSKSPHGL